MIKYLLIIIGSSSILACSRQNDLPGLGQKDSLLVTPLVEQSVEARSPKDSTGLYIDSTMLKQHQDVDVLKRLTPKQVLDIYESYRPLRNGRTLQASLDSFLTKKQITLPELHSALAEGDRLGWSGSPVH
jgi:hypothetical protein